MKLNISMLPVPLRRFVLLVASTILLLSPCYLTAQAAGTPSGQPTGQDPAAAGQNSPHKPTPQEVEEAFRRAHRKAKKSPKIKNTHSGDDPQTAAIRAALEQLRAGRSNAGNTPGSSSGSGQTTNAGGSTPAGSNPTGANPAGAGSGRNSGSTTTGSSNPPVGTPGVPPGNAPGSSGGGSRSVSVASMAMARPAMAIPAPATPPPPAPNSAASRGALATQPNLSVLGCSTKQLMILSINGVKTGISNPNIVFTQDPQYNDYKISGCNFGSTQGQAHLNGPFRSGVVPLQIKSWTDNLIEVMLDPNLKGEPDQNSVTLVINPVGSAQAQLQNCKFYALRQQVMLPHLLSSSSVTLAQIIDDNGTPVPTVKFASPYKDPLTSDTTTFTAGVDRYDSYRFNPATDIWDLSNLAPGFVATEFSLSHWATEDCEQGFNVFLSDPTIYNDGQWGAQWDPGNPKRILVNVAEQHCHDGYRGQDASNSSYALEIQVTGPIGVNPVQ